MKKTITLFFTVVSCLVCCQSMMAQEIFQKHFGSAGIDVMTDMLRLPDGKYIGLGYSQKTTGDSSFTQLVKLDTNMNVIWSKTFTFNNQMRTTDITQANDGGYFLAGRTWQTPTNAAKQGAFVIKTDSLGNNIWSKIIRFDATGTENMTKVIEEADGTLRYFITGATTTTYLKANASGVPVNASAVNPTNGTFDFLTRKVVRISPERYAMLGAFENTADHIIMLNRDTIFWTKEYSGIINDGRILNIIPDATGNMYFVGDYRAGNYELRQIHVGKLNPDGGLRWTTVLPLIKNGGRGIDTVWRFTLGNHAALANGKLYVSGNMFNEQKRYSYGTISAFDTAAPVGAGRNWLWTRQYGTKTSLGDSLTRIFSLPNGQLMGIGNTVLGGNVGKPNFFAIKTDASGMSSCNMDSYNPVEQVSGTAYLAIQRPFVGLAPILNANTTYNDAIPTTTALPIGTTNTICVTNICPSGVVTATISPLSICRFDTLTFNAMGATNYIWTNPILGDARADSSFRARIDLDGAYTFNFSGTPRGQTCFASQVINVNVKPLPSAGISAPRFMCSGDSLTIASGALNTNVVTWFSASNSPWRAGSAQTNMVAKPTAVGVHTYNVRVVDPATTCANTNSTTITVRENVVPTVTFDPLNCPGPDLILRARGTNEGATPFFDWLVEGNLVSGQRELFLPNAIGKSVQVIMKVGADVCPLPPNTRQIASIIKIVSCQGVSNQELTNKNRVLVFPNPTDGNFSVSINLENPKTLRMRIINLLGQTVENVAPRSLNSGEYLHTFQINNLATGIYLLETKLDDQIIMTKIQIQ
ncbi:MAG: hypothetical protein RL757_3250 [Bacteroidota bacterium]|jgi:hypothetical protein